MRRESTQLKTFGLQVLLKSRMETPKLPQVLIDLALSVIGAYCKDAIDRALEALPSKGSLLLATVLFFALLVILGLRNSRNTAWRVRDNSGGHGLIAAAGSIQKFASHGGSYQEVTITSLDLKPTSLDLEPILESSDGRISLTEGSPRATFARVRIDNSTSRRTLEGELSLRYDQDAAGDTRTSKAESFAGAGSKITVEPGSSVHGQAVFPLDDEYVGWCKLCLTRPDHNLVARGREIVESDDFD